MRRGRWTLAPLSTSSHRRSRTNGDWLGANAVIDHDRWCDTFGNLTLTAYNADISNRPLLEKAAYYADSRISLTRELSRLTN